MANAIEAAAVRRISAANLLETAIVIDAGRNPVASRRVDDLVHAAGLVIEPVPVDHVVVARAANRDFGKGSGHRARLNFGDCFAYALARVTGEPLLFKGISPTPTLSRRWKRPLNTPLTASRPRDWLFEGGPCLSGS